MPIGQRDRGPSNKQLIALCQEAMVQHHNGLLSDYQLLCYLWKQACKAKEHPKQPIITEARKNARSRS